MHYVTLHLYNQIIGKCIYQDQDSVQEKRLDPLPLPHVPFTHDPQHSASVAHAYPSFPHAQTSS